MCQQEFKLGFFEKAKTRTIEMDEGISLCIYFWIFLQILISIYACIPNLYFSVFFGNEYSLPAQQKFTPEQWDEKLDNCYSLLMKGSPEEGFECLQKLGPFLEKSGDYAGITDYYLQMSEY